jgi:hypothetical protein
MRNKFYAISILAILFTSCQKEITLEVAGSGNTGGTTGTGGPASATGVTGGSDGTLLLRAVRKSGNDSVVATLSYNSSDKFITYTAIGKEKFDTFNIVYNIKRFYTRDAAGRITNIIAPNDMDTTFFGPVDSTRSVVRYPNATSTEFSSVVTKTDVFIMSSIDSTVYTYSNGKVTSSVTYTSNTLFPGPPTVASKAEFDYDASGNVKELRQYGPSQTSTAIGLAAKTTYTYDTKPSTYFFKNDGLLIGDIYYGPNNILSSTQVNYNTNQTNKVTAAYNYNSSNIPKNGQMVVTPPYRAFTLTFYYR